MPDARTTNRHPSGRDTLRLANPETMVEPRPNDAMPSAEEMFLSPRVLDAGAFARYADTLKSLINDARQGARDLQDFAADADEMTVKCDKTAELIKSRVEAGARVVKLIDERADRAEHLMRVARESLPDAEKLESQARQATEEALSGAQARADAVARGVETKADVAVNDAARRLEQSAARIESRLQAVAEHASEQADRLEKASAAIDERLAEIEARLASVTERTEHQARRTRQELEPILARADQATSSIERTISQAQQHAESQAEDIAQRVRAQVEPAHRACDAVLERLSIDPDDPDPSGSVLARLDDLVSRSERSLSEAGRATADLGELAGQAERVRAEFGTWLIEAATNLDILEARRERLVGPLGEAADRIAKVSPLLKDELESAALRLDQLQTEQSILREAIGSSSVLARQSGETLNNQAAQMRALVDGSMRTLTERVEEAGVWLGQMIRRAEQLGGMPPAHNEPQATPADPAIAPDHTPDHTPAYGTGHETGHHERQTHEDPQPEDTAMHERPDSAGTETKPVTDSHQTAEPKMRDYGLPAPPALPIDAVSFDGAEIVFGDADDTDPQPAD